MPSPDIAHRLVSVYRVASLSEHPGDKVAGGRGETAALFASKDDEAGRRKIVRAYMLKGNQIRKGI